MRFTYQYRTAKNELRSGELKAASKDAAYAALKAQGIKPSRVQEASGLLNKLFGKGKRWIAIVVLAGVAVVSLLFAWKGAQPATAEPRAQLYGDPVVIRTCEEAGWTNVFMSAFDCRLARYAIPGRKVDPLPPIVTAPADATRSVAIGAKDLAEVAQMKRMVNGMKLELAAYIADGGNVEGYLKRLGIRQHAEHGFFETARSQVTRAKDLATWQRVNAELRAMGLPLVDLPEEE